MKICFTIPFATYQEDRIEIFHITFSSILSSLKCSKKEIFIDLIIYLNGESNYSLNTKLKTLINKYQYIKRINFRFINTVISSKTFCVNDILTREKKCDCYIFCDNDIILPINFFDSLFRIHYNSRKREKIGCFTKYPGNLSSNDFTKKLGRIFHPSSQRFLIKKNILFKFRPTGSIYYIKGHLKLNLPRYCNEAEILINYTEAFDTKIYVRSFISECYHSELNRRINQIINFMKSNIKSYFKNSNLLTRLNNENSELFSPITESIGLHRTILEEAQMKVEF